ncbi:hypothetical protein GE061_014004 [Apolygus lucorum]|uniref:C2H2-type domain-containing protein n=1 Tax=Apolygus lucorum TaxID=248454 RepID=A0A8S9XPA4_APOLU|nr:hypothetical protein GE061_014004 [Apolygus lucorum]
MLLATKNPRANTSAPVEPADAQTIHIRTECVSSSDSWWGSRSILNHCGAQNGRGDSNQWKCPDCGDLFTKWSELSLHLWRSHSLDIDLYSCDLCDFKTNNLSKLMNVHRKIHGSDRPYLCDTCGKGFKTSKQLATHKVLHNKSKKPLQQGSEVCEVCSRKFADPRLLRHHMDIVHRGLRPYVCNVCSYSASSMSTLKMHLRSHTGEKPYECPYCRYKTADHNSLRRHKMRHSGDKLYKCPHCSYASIQSTTYKDHLKNKHPGLDDGLMFCCNYCSFRTVNNKIFLTHVSSHSILINDKPQGDSKMDNGLVELEASEAASISTWHTS